MILLSGLLALQDKESTYTDTSVQAFTDKLNQDSSGHLHITYCTLSIIIVMMYYLLFIWIDSLYSSSLRQGKGWICKATVSLISNHLVILWRAICVKMF